MTQQYVAGELSLLLGHLQASTRNEAATVEVAHLRHRAETGPLSTLATVAATALEVADGMCWDSLTDGDPTAFRVRARIGDTGAAAPTTRRAKPATAGEQCLGRHAAIAAAPPDTPSAPSLADVQPFYCTIGGRWWIPGANLAP